MQLETKLIAKFVPDMPPTTPEAKAKLDKLNKETEAIAERLQTTFRTLIIEMLDIKRGG